jgi:hypothetical protein
MLLPDLRLGDWELGFLWSLVIASLVIPRAGKAPPTAGTRPDSSGGPLRPTPARPDRPRPPASAINHEPSTLNRLKCQRTTDTVLHSALEIRHSKFPRTLPRLASLRKQHAAIPIPATRAFAGSTFYLFLLSMRPASHKTAPPDYVTLHGLHDLKGNPRQTQNRLPRPASRTKNAAPTIPSYAFCVLSQLNFLPSSTLSPLRHSAFICGQTPPSALRLILFLVAWLFEQPPPKRHTTPANPDAPA